MGTLSRSGSNTTLAITNGLGVGGTAMLVLDDTYGSVATTITGNISHQSGTLVIVPENGHLSGSEGVSFTQAPTLTNGILGSWAVAQ